MTTNTGVETLPKAAASTSQPPSRGKTYIADEVVSVIARMAAEQVEGIHRIGEPSLRNFMGSFGRTQGVAAEVGLVEAAADIEIVVDYGYPIREVANAIRDAVTSAVEHMTGRKMIEVNIHVVDVHIPKVQQKPRRELR